MSIHSTPPKERGQAILILAVGLVVLLGFAGLAIDGGRLFTLQRDAQNAVDMAAMAAASAACNSQDPVVRAQNLIVANGFAINDPSKSIASITSPAASGQYAGVAGTTLVVLTASIPSALIHLVYPGPLLVSASAVSRCSQNAAPDESNGFDQIVNAAMGFGQECDTSNNPGFEIGSSNSYIVGPIYGTYIRDGDGSNSYYAGGASSTVGSQLTGSSPTFAAGSVYNAVVPQQTDPLAGFLTVDQYAPGGSRVASLTPGVNYFDLSTGNNNIPNGAKGVYYFGKRTAFIGPGTFSVTVVTDGNIKVNGAITKIDPYLDGVALFANQNLGCSANAITVDSGAEPLLQPVFGPGGAPNIIGVNPEATIAIHGLVYVPNGRFSFSGSKNSVRGAIVARSLIFGGSNSSIVFDNSYFPLPQQGPAWTVTLLK